MKKITLAELKKKFTPEKKDPAKMRMHPSRDWQLLVAGFVVLNIASVVLYGFVFVSTLALEPEGATAPGAREELARVDKKKLAETLEAYRERKALFEQIVPAEDTPAVDPQE